MKKIVVLSLFAFIIAGCKTDVKTSITTDELASSEHTNVDGNILVQVLSCSSYEDSRVESRILIEAKTKVASILADSEYIECYDKQMKSYASFKIPVGVGAVGNDGSLSLNNDVFIFSSNDITLGVVLNPYLLKRMRDVEESSPFSQKIDLNMTITLNAGEKPIPTTVWQGVYLSDNENNVKQKPAMMTVREGKDLKKVVVTLSDVASSTLMTGDIAIVGWSPDALIQSIKASSAKH